MALLHGSSPLPRGNSVPPPDRRDLGGCALAAPSLTGAARVSPTFVLDDGTRHDPATNGLRRDTTARHPPRRVPKRRPSSGPLRGHRSGRHPRASRRILPCRIGTGRTSADSGSRVAPCRSSEAARRPPASRRCGRRPEPARRARRRRGPDDRRRERARMSHGPCADIARVDAVDKVRGRHLLRRRRAGHRHEGAARTRSARKRSRRMIRTTHRVTIRDPASGAAHRHGLGWCRAVGERLPSRLL